TRYSLDQLVGGLAFAGRREGDAVRYAGRCQVSRPLARVRVSPRAFRPGPSVAPLVREQSPDRRSGGFVRGRAHVALLAANRAVAYAGRRHPRARSHTAKRTRRREP